MSVASCTYRLAAANTYETPEKALEGILKETEEAAKQFSPDTQQRVKQSAQVIAETAKQMITNLATELCFKIQNFPDTGEEAMCSTIRQTWDIADTMRRLCLNTLEDGAYAETLKKVSNVKKDIEGASFDQLAANSYVAPAVAGEGPKPLSENLQNLSKLTGKFTNVYIY